MAKFAVVFPMILIVLEIVFADRYHGHGSYKEYYNHVNGGQPKPITSYDMSQESHYDRNDVGEESHVKDNSQPANRGSFGFSDEWQARSGVDDYAGVARCDDIKQTFCEYVPNYPQDAVNRMLAKNFSLLHYANEDVIDPTPRLGNEEEPLCLSSERIISPRMAINRRDQWMLIAQTDNFKQNLRIETCIEEDAKCRIIDGFAEGYVTTCKQKYIYRELSAISLPDGNEIVRDYFRLPASCCCHVQFQGNDERTKSFLKRVFGPRVMPNTYV